MKLIVFSDSHGDLSRMRAALRRHPDAGYCLHAGDGAREFALLRELFPGVAFAGVAGNCDFLPGGERPPEQCTLELGGKRIFLCHGHRFAVKGSTALLEEYAFENGIDVAVFGHTHEPCDRSVAAPDGRTVRLFNPGSVGGRGWGRATYGVIDIRPNGTLFSVAEC